MSKDQTLGYVRQTIDDMIRESAFSMSGLEDSGYKNASPSQGASPSQQPSDGQSLASRVFDKDDFNVNISLSNSRVDGTKPVITGQGAAATLKGGIEEVKSKLGQLNSRYADFRNMTTEALNNHGKDVGESPSAIKGMVNHGNLAGVVGVGGLIAGTFLGITPTVLAGYTLLSGISKQEKQKLQTGSKQSIISKVTQRINEKAIEMKPEPGQAAMRGKEKAPDVMALNKPGALPDNRLDGINAAAVKEEDVAHVLENPTAENLPEYIALDNQLAALEEEETNQLALRNEGLGLDSAIAAVDAGNDAVQKEMVAPEYNAEGCTYWSGSVLTGNIAGLNLSEFSVKDAGRQIAEAATTPPEPTLNAEMLKQMTAKASTAQFGQFMS